MIIKKISQYRAEEDGEGSSGGDTIGTGNAARVALLNAINDINDNAQAEDLADVNDDGTTSTFVPEKSLAERLDEEVEVVTPEPAPTAQTVKLKVNGKEVDMPLDEVIAKAQKVETADLYLQEAVRARREAQALVPQVQTPAPPPPDTRAQQAAEDAERRALARAIQMGTEEEAVAAIAKLQTMGRQPTGLTVADVSRVADERMNFNRAISWFNSEYKDLVSNPELHRMVLATDAEMIRNGDKRPYEERYADVGNQVRAWRDNLVASVAPNVTSMDARRAAKAAAPSAPTSAAAKATPVKQDDEDESVSQVIANMAKARGGPQWARG